MTFRTARQDELALILTWAAAEGWNPGQADAAAFHAADPAGFFVAERDGRPVAAISVVNHDADHAFLGLYLCLPDWRGRGIGFGLWTHALQHAGARSVGLDGVAAQQANYAKSGFRLIGATRRWEGSLTPASSPHVRDAAPGDLPQMLALDRLANGVDRHAFLTAWVAPCDTRRTVVLEQDGRIAGFAVIRLCRQGCKIGPILAPSADQAVELARAALAVMPAEQLIIDVPEANLPLTQILQAAGFVNSFTTARMVRGTPPATGHALQAIATMELG